MDTQHRNETTTKTILPGAMVIIAVITAGALISRLGSPQPQGPFPGVVLSGEPDSPDRHVTLALGGGFHHYGVMIGAPGFEPSPSDDWEVIRWADGIWGIQER